MAKNDDIKSQLGTFMRAALAQLDTVREVVVQRSKAGRIQIDVALLRRQRRAVLAELGGVVARLAGSGKLSEDDFPELGAPLSRLEALDEQIASEEERARMVGLGQEPDPFADRSGSAEDDGDVDESDDDLDSPAEKG